MSLCDATLEHIEPGSGGGLEYWSTLCLEFEKKKKKKAILKTSSIKFAFVSYEDEKTEWLYFQVFFGFVLRREQLYNKK